MKWKINDYMFNTEHQSLNARDKKRQLEPLQAKVLAYFCEHQNEIVSREQLVRDVWPTSVVSDNTVNRVIAKLRKALGDSSQSPRYIVTYPRQGYMFIARAENCIEQNLRSKWYVSLAPLFMAAAIILSYIVFHPAESSGGISVVPLTRGSAPEYHPAISPDGKYLAYSVLQEQRLTLQLKHLSGSEIVHLATDDVWSGYPAWSADGNKLVYMANGQRGCSIELVKFADEQIVQQQTVHHCPEDNFAKLAFSHDGKHLIYAQRQSVEAPYYLFKMNLRTGAKAKLNQPAPLHAGHFHFDLHPQQNSLLVATPDEQLWLNVYRLDLDDNSFSRLFKLDEYLCCAIWAHQGQGVVMMSEKPGYELVEYTLDGRALRTIYSAGQQITMPARHSNGRDYVFVEAHNNINIHWRDKLGRKSSVVSSSTIDTLPAVSPGGDFLAFISDRSGQAEIWIHDLTTAKNHKLTDFADHRHYLALNWSPDEGYIAALSLNEIKLVDVSNGSIESLKLPQRKMNHLSWKDNQTLTFSAQSRQGWTIVSYDIHSHKSTLLDSSYIALMHNRQNASRLWLSRDGKQWVTDTQEPIELPGMASSQGFGEPIIYSHEDIYYRVFDSGLWHVMKWNLAMQSDETITSSNYPIEFDVRDKDVYFSKTNSINADIFTTKVP